MSAVTMPEPGRLARTTLDEVLAPLHERWLAAVQMAVRPALSATSTRWDRWTAARYLRDELADRLGQERKLVRTIPELDRAGVRRIEAGFEVLERVLAEATLAGRRRHTGGLMMVLLKSLLEHLADWYVAVEHATADVPLTRLPPEAVAILSEFQPDEVPSAAW